MHEEKTAMVLRLLFYRNQHRYLRLLVLKRKKLPIAFSANSSDFKVLLVQLKQRNFLRFKSFLMLSIREITTDDIPLLVNYWLDSDPEFMKAMGVDLTKLPEREVLAKMLSSQLSQDYTEKQSYALIWLLDQKPVGHCNVNKIAFGKSAFLHLHLWQSKNRQKGMGSALIKLSLPYFFEKLKLKIIYCEPYALNPSPNKTLAKLGFTFEKEYITTPGYLNFEQPVKRWSLSLKAWEKMK